MTTTAIKEKPILFSAPMVRAILEGRKTQTRRIVKPHPCWPAMKPDRLTNVIGGFEDDVGQLFKAKYKPGDLLYIKTGYKTRYEKEFDQTYWSAEGGFITTHGQATSPSTKRIKKDGNHPGMFMPAWLSDSLYHWRLLVERVDAEPIRRINRDAAIREGAFLNENDWWEFGTGHRGMSSPEAAFLRLWESINGHESWDRNDWVWVYTFRKVNQ